MIFTKTTAKTVIMSYTIKLTKTNRLISEAIVTVKKFAGKQKLYISNRAKNCYPIINLNFLKQNLA